MYCSRITSSNPTLETTHQIATLHPVHTFHCYITIDKNALAMRNRSRVSLILTVLSLPSVAARKIWQGKHESTRFTPSLSVQTACTDHKHKLQKIKSSQGMSLNEGLNTGFLTYRAFPLWYCVLRTATKINMSVHTDCPSWTHFTAEYCKLVSGPKSVQILSQHGVFWYAC